MKIQAFSTGPHRKLSSGVNHLAAYHLPSKSCMAKFSFIFYCFSSILPPNIQLFPSYDTKNREKECTIHNSILPQNNPYHHGCTQHGRDDIDRDETVGGQGADEVARQGQAGPGEHGGGQERAVVGSAHEQTGQMRHSQADEGDGAAEGHAGGGEQPRDY